MEPQPAYSIRDRGNVPHKKSRCMAAIFTFLKSLFESLAKRGRPCMSPELQNFRTNSRLVNVAGWRRRSLETWNATTKRWERFTLRGREVYLMVWKNCRQIFALPSNRTTEKHKRVASPFSFGFSQLKSFLKNFVETTKVVSSVTGVLKNKGLDQSSYDHCCQLSKTLPKCSKVKKELQIWLQQHIKIKRQITPLPLLVSSDIIESLFGNFNIL